MKFLGWLIDPIDHWKREKESENDEAEATGRSSWEPRPILRSKGIPFLLFCESMLLFMRYPFSNSNHFVLHFGWFVMNFIRSGGAGTVPHGSAHRVTPALYGNSQFFLCCAGVSWSFLSENCSFCWIFGWSLTLWNLYSPYNFIPVFSTCLLC